MCLAFIGLFIYKGLLCFAMCIPTNFIMSEAMQCHWAVIVCAALEEWWWRCRKNGFFLSLRTVCVHVGVRVFLCECECVCMCVIFTF